MHGKPETVTQPFAPVDPCGSIKVVIRIVPAYLFWITRCSRKVQELLTGKERVVSPELEKRDEEAACPI